MAVAVPRVLALLFTMWLSACQDVQLVGLRFQFGGCTGSAPAVSLTIQVLDANNIEVAKNTDSIPDSGQLLGLRLPASLQGEYRFELTATDAQGGVVARGSAAATLSGRADSKEAPPEILASLQCTSGTEPILDPAQDPAHSWSIRCGSNGNDFGSSVAFDKTGNVFIAGSFGGDNISCTFLNTEGDPSGSLAILGKGGFLAKLSSTGKVLWRKRLDGTQQLNMTQPSAFYPHVTTDDAGNAIIWGAAEGGPVQLDGSSTVIPASSQFVAKYDADGNFKWQQTADTNIGTFHTVAARTIGGVPRVIIGGSCSTNTQFFVPGLKCDANESAFLLRYDDAGSSLQSPILRTFTGKRCTVTRIFPLAQEISWTAYCQGGAPGIDMQYSMGLVSLLSRHTADLVPTSLAVSRLAEEPVNTSYPTAVPNAVPPLFAASAVVDGQDQTYALGTLAKNKPDLRFFPSKESVNTKSEDLTVIDPLAAPGFLEFDQGQNPLVAGQVFRNFEYYDLFVTKYQYRAGTGLVRLWSSPIIFKNGIMGASKAQPMWFASDSARNRFAVITRTELDPFDADPANPRMKLLSKAQTGGTGPQIVLVVMAPAPKTK